MAVQFAKRLTLIVFAALTLRGLVDGADLASTLRSGLLAIPVFLCVGLVCGEIARRVVEEQVERDLATTPAVDSSSATDERE